MIKIVEIVKIDNRYYIEIPKDIAELLGKEILLTKTKEGIIIKKNTKELTNDELLVLKKLNSFKFEKRIPSEVNKILTKTEKNSLDLLISKKIVSIYASGKYTKTGVYSISQSVYPKIVNKKENIKKGFFDGADYLIIKNEDEAKRISDKLKEEIKRGEIRGTRGFDGKFYISTTDFYNKNKNLIISLLEENKKGLKLTEISTKTKLTADACLTILRLLDEDGEIIEKGKNTFILI